MNGLLALLEIDDENGADPTAETWDLRNELRTLDLEPRLVEDTYQQDGSKSLGSIVRWLELRDLTMDGVKAVVATALQWAIRTRRTVKVKIDGNVLILSDATSEQQDRIIEAFIAHHGSNA